MTQNIYNIGEIFCHNQKIFFLKNTSKVALQYLFNVFVLFNIVFNLKFNFKLKIDQKVRTFKNLKEIMKNLKKASGNPVKTMHLGGYLRVDTHPIY